MKTGYDVIVVGGGMGGSALARSLAEQGARVLVIERERGFRDRIRGEQMQPWGVEEARTLGIHDLLHERVGHDQPWVDVFLGEAPMGHRDLTMTTPQAAPHFNFYHPAMQETLLRAAEEAGVEVRRGAAVTEVHPGAAPSVRLERNGTSEEVGARLVVGADGRNSLVRRHCGFEVSRDAPFLMIAGVLLDHVPILEDNGYIYMNPRVSRGAYLFPQGNGRVRAYAAYPVSAGFRLQGDRDLPRFLEESAEAGASADFFSGIETAGPLGSFEAADAWVEHPYRDGIALVGDAAAANDPCFGQGLSLTLRDVRVLRDALLADEDWEQAGHRYAAEHDRHYGVIHEVTLAAKEMFLRSGPEADARRARSLPRIAEDPTRVPDHVFCGPDLPWDAGVRNRFFGED